MTNFSYKHQKHWKFCNGELLDEKSWHGGGGGVSKNIEVKVVNEKSMQIFVKKMSPVFINSERKNRNKLRLQIIVRILIKQ